VHGFKSQLLKIKPAFTLCEANEAFAMPASAEQKSFYPF